MKIVLRPGERLIALAPHPTLSSHVLAILSDAMGGHARAVPYPVAALGDAFLAAWGAAWAAHDMVLRRFFAAAILDPSLNAED